MDFVNGYKFSRCLIDSTSIVGYLFHRDGNFEKCFASYVQVCPSSINLYLNSNPGTTVVALLLNVIKLLLA